MDILQSIKRNENVISIPYIQLCLIRDDSIVSLITHGTFRFRSLAFDSSTLLCVRLLLFECFRSHLRITRPSVNCARPGLQHDADRALALSLKPI